MSKLRYGLQFCSQVRTRTEDPINQNVKAMQIAQNKMLQMLEGVSLKDHITTKSLLDKHNLPSVNQISAEIKITEAWKIMNIIDYPITLEENNPNRNTGDREARNTTQREWKEHSKHKASSESFTVDTARLWNKVDTEIKTAQSLGIVKSLIKKYCKTLEI